MVHSAVEVVAHAIKVMILGVLDQKRWQRGNGRQVARKVISCLLRVLKFVKVSMAMKLGN